MVKSLGECMQTAREDWAREQAIKKALRAERRRFRKTLALSFIFGAIIGAFAGSCKEARADVPMTPKEVLAMGAAVDAACPPMTTAALEAQIIKDERANPAGVIDLRKLHEAGAILQAARLEEKSARLSNALGLEIFRRWAHKPLDLGFCEAHARAEASQ